jgi:hypothetical protein
VLLFGQFHGSTHQLNGQFHGICLKESQPLKRTFAGRAAPLKPTFGRVNAPPKPTFCLILRDLTKHPNPDARMQVFQLRSARDRETARPHTSSDRELAGSDVVADLKRDQGRPNQADQTSGATTTSASMAGGGAISGNVTSI